MQNPEPNSSIDRREAIRRVSAILGGAVLVGGSSLVTACEKADDRARGAAAQQGVGTFTPSDIAYLDEVAETILPETKTPGAKAAKVGAFMALMVTDTYEPKDQQVFRDGMRALDEASQRANQKTFMQATPAQRLALLESLDREAKEYHDRRDEAHKAKKKQGADTTARDTTGRDTVKAHVTGSEPTGAEAITADAPDHYFRMMKELTMLGYFTSEIGYTKAMRYVETPGRFDPCVPYAPGEVSWAPHA